MDNIVEDEVMRQIKFTVPGPPFGKQRPKFSRAGEYVKTYTPDKTVNYENLVKLMYQQAAKGRMFSEDAALDVRITIPLSTGPASLKCSTTWTFPRPQRRTKNDSF